MYKPRGFFGLAMYHPKNKHNWGTLLRTANLLKTNFICTIGRRFPKQPGDTLKTWKHVPIFHFDTIEEFYEHLPYDCQLVGIELDESAKDLREFKHPERACYLLGAEDNGLPEKVLDKCHKLVKLRGEASMNVAVAGSIVLYHRVGLC